MSAFALVTGSLFRQPEQRTSKSGKLFVTATIRAKDGEASQWWKVVAFSESASELYQPGGGEPKVSLSIIADRVLAHRQPPKERAATAPEPTQDTRRKERLAGAREWQPGDGPDDSIPF